MWQFRKSLNRKEEAYSPRKMKPEDSGKRRYDHPELTKLGTVPALSRYDVSVILN